MPAIDIVELRQAVQRMEQRLRADVSPLVQDMMECYDELRTRFSADLQDERDLLLSYGAALMLIQQVARRSKKGTNL